MAYQQQFSRVAAAQLEKKAAQAGKRAAHQQVYKPVTYRYGPCKRNHALGSGGNLLDGCQEFDTDNETSKICAACGCHRSFHARVSEDGKSLIDEQKEPSPQQPPQQQPPPIMEVEMQEKETQEIQQSVSGFTTTLVSPPANVFLASVSSEDSRDLEKTLGKGRKPCRSKQLRAKGCQIWTDYLRPWLIAQGINIRFCDNKEVCVAEMQKGGHPTCIAKCNQLKWPPFVPLAHPKDMASRELQAFINVYEREWQEHCLRNHGVASACTLLPRLRKDLDPCKVTTKELRYWLREKGKAVFCVHPKAANQFVNMGKLATMILRSGGKCKFEGANGWEKFVSSREGMNKPALTSGERKKCIRTIKRLYNRFMMEYIQDTLKGMGLETDGEMAVAEVSDDGGAVDFEGNDEDEDTDLNKEMDSGS